MQRRVLGTALLAAVLMTTATLTEVPATATAARAVAGEQADQTSTRLPLTGFSHLAVDAVHGRVFVTGEGLPEDGLVVLDEDGDVLTTVEGSGGAYGLALTPDSSTLYVTLPRSDRIGVLDTATLAFRTYQLPADANPGEAVVADGTLWFGDLDGWRLMAWDLAGHRRPTEVTGACDTWCTLLPVPGHPHQVVLVADGVDRLVVHGGANPSVRFVDGRGDLGAVSGAVSPDGRRILTMGSTGASVLELSTLGGTDFYPAHALWDSYGYGAAVAVRADGTVAVGSHTLEYSSPYLRLYRPGQTTPTRGFDVVDAGGDVTDRELPGRGLAFGRTNLYAVTTGAHGEAPVLDVYRRPAARQPSGTPTDPATTPLPFEHFDRMLVVRRHGRVFYTGGVDENGVVVTDLRGRHPRLLQHLPGAGQMALSPDRERVYVALASGDAVARIDTRTLDVRRIDTGPRSAPHGLVLVDGDLWFLTSDEVQERLCRVRSGGRTPRCWPVRGFHTRLWPDPVRRHHVLVTWSSWPVLADRYRLHPTRGPLLERSRRLGARADAVATTPDRLHVLTDSVLGPAPTVFTARSLRPAALLLPEGSGATAVRRDGLVATAPAMDEHDSASATTQTLLLWRSWAGPAVRRSHLSGTAARGLAFTSRRLLAVTRRETDFRSRVAVELRDAPPVRRLTVDSDRAAYTRGQTARVVAHLVGDRRPVIAVHAVTRHHRRLVARGRPDGAGNLRTRVVVRGATRFTARVVGRPGTAVHVDRQVVPEPAVLLVSPWRSGSGRVTGRLERSGLERFGLERFGLDRSSLGG